MLTRITLFVLLAAFTADAQTAPALTADKATIAFTHTIGAAKLPAAQTINAKSTPAGLNFSAAITGPAPHAGAWLLPSVYAGRTPQAMSLQVNPTGLAAGTYTATLTLSATSGATNLTSTVTVTLVVGTPAASITTNPTTLAFTYITGQPIAGNPALSKTFVLSNTGSALPAAVSVTGAAWLKVTPTGNITLVGLLNTITATADPTGLAPKTYTATIKIDSKLAATPTVSVAVTLTVQASPPTTGLTWPAGAIQQSAVTVVTLNGTDFFSTSTAAVAGFTSAATITVTDGVNATTETLYIPAYAATNAGLRIAMGSPLPGAIVNVPLAPITLQAAGATGAVAWSVSGALPPGLGIANGVLSGTPTAAGNYYFTLQVQDSSTPAPKVASLPTRITILPSAISATPRITGPNLALPAATVGAAYAGGLAVSAIGGAGPLSYSATGLPPGLSMDAVTGAITGTCTTVGVTGALVASVVSERAMLITIPSTMLATPGILRIIVTTPAPGGGTSNEAPFLVYGPAPQINAIVNSASLFQGKISPGEIVTIFGLGLGPTDLTLFDPSGGTIPTSLPAGTATAITFNGISAPLLYTSGTQVASILPYNAAGPNVDVVVTYGSIKSQPFTLSFVAGNPAIFTTTNDGRGQGAILNFVPSTSDYVLNSSSAPAAKGQTVVLYVNGIGPTTSQNVTALTPASPAVTPTGTVTVTIGGQSASVSGAVAPPGSVPGLLQINVTVPANAPTGQAVPVLVNVDGFDSQPGVTMSIK